MKDKLINVAKAIKELALSVFEVLKELYAIIKAKINKDTQE